MAVTHLHSIVLANSLSEIERLSQFVDRVTGEPVWPIEERPVPPSDVPGEAAWPTQPFPTRPPPFEAQGVSLDDAFDLTPELKAAAQAEMKKYRLGPLYTPPSAEGTIVRPGVWGGANWGGGAFDPDTGLLYFKSAQSLAIFSIRQFDPAEQPADRQGEVDAEFIQRSLPPVFMNGLPLTRPPYAHLVAMDLNQGTIAWKVPFGDMPELRKHPALAGLDLPPRLGAPGPAGAIVTRGGLVLIGSLGLSVFRPTASFGVALQEYLANPVERTHDGLWRQCLFDLESVRRRLGEDEWEAFKAYNLDRLQAAGRLASLGWLMDHFGLPAIPAADLSRIAAPTALIWGREDRATPLSVAEEASGRFDWPLYVIDDAADVADAEEGPGPGQRGGKIVPGLRGGVDVQRLDGEQQPGGDILLRRGLGAGAPSLG